MFERGYGVETYVDEHGGVQERQVPLQPGDKVPFANGHELGLDEEGDKTVWVKTEVGLFQAALPRNPTDERIGDIIRSVQMRVALHGINMAHIFYPGVHDLEFGGGEVAVRDPDDFVITEKLRRIIIGNEALEGNNLFNQSDIDKIPYLMQFHNRKGDYAIADINPETMVEDFRTQGVLDEDSNVNWERFEELVWANRAGLYSSEENFAKPGPR